jgi:hypothetical protein
VWIVCHPQKPSGPIPIGAEAPAGDGTGLGHAAFTQQIQRGVRVAKRDLHICMPIALSGVKAVIGNDEHEVAEAIAGMMARAKCQRIVRIKIEIEVRPCVGAPEARESVPGRADLQIEAPAEESHRSRLDRRLQLHILPDIERGVGARPRLSAKDLVGVRADPCARVLGTPAKIDVRSKVVGVGIFTERELPRQACGVVGRGRATSTEKHAHAAGDSDPHNDDCSRFGFAGAAPVRGVPPAAGSRSMMH